MFENGADAAAENAVGRGMRRIESAAPLGSEITDGGQKVRLVVAKAVRGGVIGLGDAVLHALRNLLQQVIGKAAAAMRRVDGRDRGDAFRAENGGCTDVQPTFGMCNDIDLFAAGLCADGFNACTKLGGAVLDGRGGLMLAVENLRTIAFQRGRYASPIGRKFEIAEKHAVHEQQGIMRGADACIMTLCVETVFCVLKVDLVLHNAEDSHELNQIQNRDKTAEQTNCAAL